MEHCVAIVREKYRDQGSLATYSQCNLDEQIIVKLQLVIKKRGEHFISCSSSKEYAVINYDDILTKPHKGSTEGSGVRRVLVEGGAGTGKTALCISVTNGWANGHTFQQFELLLFLPLHQQQIASASSLPELIESLMLEINPQTVASELQQRNGEGVLIVADGWNDLPKSKRLEGSFIYSLLFGNTLRHASVMVTSRQTASTPLHMNAFIDRFTEVCGFNEESIVEYIQSDLLNDDEQAEYVLEQIHNNPLLQSICRVPLCCTTICHMTQSLSEGLPITMTDLCTKIAMKILCHNISKSDTSVSIASLPKIDDLPQNLQDLWWRLCKLAFLTIEKNQVDFSQFQSFQYGIELTGLVEVVPHGDNDIVSANFLHSTFQKYLAAVYVVKQPADIQVNTSRTIRFQQLFDFWRYYFGLSTEKEHKLLKQVIHAQAVDNSSKCLLCQCAYEAANSTITNEVIKSLCTKICQKTFIHFGEPHTAHDCEAILYVIASMQGSECDGMIINFRTCSLSTKQIVKFADILGSKSGKLQVREFDLSNNNLPDECVATLFDKALPAFHSLEKLSLCNNKIKEEGVRAIMKALLTQNITVLDLSLNNLSQAGLYLIQNAVKSGTLTNLEILIMKGSLTADATFNTEYFSTFSEALLSHCPHLQGLDLSSNDFGEPEALTLSSIIKRLTTKSIDLYLDPKYMSNVDKSSIKAMEDSIKNEEEIDYTIVHGVFVGPGRSGKNSLMDRLMGKAPSDPSTDSPSTGVLEKVVKVVVKKSYTLGEVVKWEKLEYDEEALELMMTTVRKNSASDDDGEMVPIDTTDHQTEYHCTQMTENSSPVAIKVKRRSVEAVYPSRAKETIELAKGSLIHSVSTSDHEPVHISPTFQLTEVTQEIFKRGLKLKRMKYLQEHLEASWSLYLTNTGGQTKFQELLPLLVCGPSVFFITFPLNQDLDKFYTERYQHEDGREETHESSSTLMDEILQILATIDTLDCIGPPTDVPLKPKVFLVGTYKDKVKVKPPHSCVKDVIEEVDKHLQEKIKKTSLYGQGSIEFADNTGQLIFTVNNLDKDDSDFQKIREALQTAVDRRKEYTIRCRPSWLIFSLVLRESYKSHQVLSKDTCFTIAQRCGIYDPAEFNEALIFIHSRLGLIRYFDVRSNGLNRFVIINPQILFDRITDLLVDTFKGDHATQSEIEKFRKCGLCSMKVIKTFNQKNKSKSKFVCKKDEVVHDFSTEKLVDLFIHLKIAACVTENGQQYCFFPASLCHAPKPVQILCLKPPPLLIAFKGGFCPRGIPGALIVYLINNKSADWKLRTSKVFRNQVSLNVGPCDITLQIFPTHLQVSIDNKKCESSNLSKEKDVCPKIYKHFKQAMETVTREHRRCWYHFTFYCLLEECKAHPHPAELDWKHQRLECKNRDESIDIPCGNNYDIWMSQLKYKGSQEDGMNLILDCENHGVSKHLGQIADSMCDWEGKFAEELGLTSANIAVIKKKYPKREALKRWKHKQGDEATYGNLISVFEKAGFKEYAETVRKLVPDVYSYQKPSYCDNPASPCSSLALLQEPVSPTVFDTVLLHKECEYTSRGEKDEIETKKIEVLGSPSDLAMASHSSRNLSNITAIEENVKEQAGGILSTKESKQADYTPLELTHDHELPTSQQSFQDFDLSKHNNTENEEDVIKTPVKKRKRKSNLEKQFSKCREQSHLTSSEDSKLSQDALEPDGGYPNLSERTSPKSTEVDHFQSPITTSVEAAVSDVEGDYQLLQTPINSNNESTNLVASPYLSQHTFSVLQPVLPSTTDDNMLNQEATPLSDGLNLILDCENDGVSKHLGQIADSMCEWEGRIAEELGLTYDDITGITNKYPNSLNLQIREALEKWKLKLGDKATYGNLISVFERANYQQYSETVRKLVPNVSSHQKPSCNNTAASPRSSPSPQEPVSPTVIDTVLLQEQSDEDVIKNTIRKRKRKSEFEKQSFNCMQQSNSTSSQDSILSQDVLESKEKVKEEKSPLILAAQSGHEMKVLALLDEGADIHFTQERSGKTALFFAAENGNHETVDILLSYGADPQCKDKNGETAYSVAKSKGHNEVCELFETQDSNKQPAVKTISRQRWVSESIETVKEFALGPLNKIYHRWTSNLIGATKHGDIQTVTDILEQGNYTATADLVKSREADSHGWTALMYACDRGNFKLVELLLGKGADPNEAAKSNGWSSLMLASCRGYLRITKKLLDSGADPNLQNNEGISPLAIAIYEGRTTVALLLLHRGADVNLEDKNGQSPLIRASNEGNLKLVKIIANGGGSINHQTMEGWSSVMVASHFGHAEVVKELAKRNADLNLSTKTGDTALHIATLCNNPEVVTALVSFGSGADLDITNKDGLTAVMIAKTKNYKEVEEVLKNGGAKVTVDPEAGDTLMNRFLMALGFPIEVPETVASQDVGVVVQKLVYEMEDKIKDFWSGGL